MLSGWRAGDTCSVVCWFCNRRLSWSRSHVITSIAVFTQAWSVKSPPAIVCPGLALISLTPLDDVSWLAARAACCCVLVLTSSTTSPQSSAAFVPNQSTAVANRACKRLTCLLNVRHCVRRRCRSAVACRHCRVRRRFTIWGPATQWFSGMTLCVSHTKPHVRRHLLDTFWLMPSHPPSSSTNRRFPVIGPCPGKNLLVGWH